MKLNNVFVIGTRRIPCAVAPPGRHVELLAGAHLGGPAVACLPLRLELELLVQPDGQGGQPAHRREVEGGRPVLTGERRAAVHWAPPPAGPPTTSENTFVGAEIHSESCFSIETSLETMQKAQNFRLRRSKGQNTNKMY